MTLDPFADSPEVDIHPIRVGDVIGHDDPEDDMGIYDPIEEMFDRFWEEEEEELQDPTLSYSFWSDDNNGAEFGEGDD